MGIKEMGWKAIFQDDKKKKKKNISKGMDYAVLKHHFR